MYLPDPLTRDDTIIWTNTMLGIEVIIIIILQCLIVFNIIRKEPIRAAPVTQNPVVSTSTHLYAYSLYENPYVTSKEHGF
jgi:hypothetical protein